MDLNDFIIYIKTNCRNKFFFSVEMSLTEVRTKIGFWKLNYYLDSKIIGFEQLKDLLRSEANVLLEKRRRSFSVYASEQLREFRIRDTTQNPLKVQFIFRRI